MKQKGGSGAGKGFVQDTAQPQAVSGSSESKKLMRAKACSRKHGGKRNHCSRLLQEIKKKTPNPYPRRSPLLSTRPRPAPHPHPRGPWAHLLSSGRPSPAPRSSSVPVPSPLPSPSQPATSHQLLTSLRPTSYI